MKDFLGQTLEVGDKVVYIRPQYRSLQRGMIVRFTKCFVFVKRLSKKDGAYQPDEIKQEPYQLVKILDEDDGVEVNTVVVPENEIYENSRGDCD